MLPMPLGDFLFGKSLKDDMMDLGITPQAYQEVKKQTVSLFVYCNVHGIVIYTLALMCLSKNTSKVDVTGQINYLYASLSSLISSCRNKV